MVLQKTINKGQTIKIPHFFKFRLPVEIYDHLQIIASANMAKVARSRTCIQKDKRLLSEIDKHEVFVALGEAIV